MITISPSAVTEIQRLMNEGDMVGWGVRVGVKGGGCSGLSYTMEMAKAPAEDDKIFASRGIRIFCDPKSLIYLNDLTLDYSEQWMGGGFKFIHPEADPKCPMGTGLNA